MNNKLLKKGKMLFALMLLFAMAPSMHAQYCVPEGTNVNRYIDNFSTTRGIENVSNLGTGFSADGYGDYSATQTISQSTGESFDFSVDIKGGTSGFRIWIDWNQDGTFDITEEVAFKSPGYAANHTGTIVVPLDAVEGDTRMRIVSHWLSSTGDVSPCATGFVYGEFEDYNFEVVIAEDCTGTPDAGIAMVAPTNGNPESTYMVTAQGYTVANGMSFQWQSNINSAGWVDEGAATIAHTPYTATAPLVVGDEVAWRLSLTCTSSGETAFSDIATFTVAINYCTASSSTVEPITKVIFAGIDNASTGTDGYEDFTAIVAEVAEGETYTFTAEGNTGGNYKNHFTVWVDWDQNGVFDPEELYEVGFIENSTGADGKQVVYDITVPADAASGETRMRVRKNYGNPYTSPCGTNSFGQVEDYTVNVGGSTGGGTFPAPYCNIEDSDDVLVEEITTVNFAGTAITNTDTTSVLIDKTDTVVNVTVGETYTLIVEGNTKGNFENYIVAFIDWNQNDVLDDAGEIYELGALENSTGADGTSVTMEITVPAGAVEGPTRIRITKSYFDEDSPTVVNPCAIQFDAFGYMIVPGFGQALDFTLNVEEGDGLDCEQGDDSNAIENGLNITAGATFRNADDFMVSADNTLNIKSIELSILAQAPITALDLNFYNDENGVPGTTVVYALTDVIPYAQPAVGTAFGYTAYSVFVEVDLEFEGGATGATFWMQPAAQGGTAFWEVSSVGTLGAPIHTSEANGVWTPDEDGSQAVFKLHCDVATAPPSECLFDITSTVEPITRLVFANVDNTSPASSSIALEDFTDVTIIADAGGTYEVSLEGNTNGPYTNFFTIFVNTSENNDWSSFETFEIGSITASTGVDGIKATSTITLPPSLVDGEYLVRVVKNFNSSPLNPCGTYSFGQGEDYTLVVGELDDCTGTPDAGIASVDPEQGNPNSAYTVTASGYDVANGLTYQWQSNTDAAGWIDEGDLETQYTSFAATAPSEDGIEVEWRLAVSCTFSSEVAYSDIATFTTISANIYCTPVLDCTDGDMITNVTFQEINNTTTCSANGYGDYTNLVAVVQSGGTFPISVSVGDGWMNESVSVWIDFNNNGTFDEEEFFYIGTGSDEALTGNIAIPASAADGDYRMRVRVAAVGQPSATWDMSCDETDAYGETEDYTVNVDGVVGVNDYAVTGFSYYPNPMTDALYITAKTDISSVSVYNLLGQEVISKKNFSDGKVDVSALPAGTFLFRVTFENGSIEDFKVLKN